MQLAVSSATEVVVRALNPVDWATLQRLRLAALRNAGDVLVGDLPSEARRSAFEWQRECARCSWFVAERAEQAVGLGRVAAYPLESPPLRLEAMWVHPDHRRVGVGRELVRKAEQMARDRRQEKLALWLVDSNYEAEILYKAIGYRPTSNRGDLADGRSEVEYVRTL